MLDIKRGFMAGDFDSVRSFLAADDIEVLSRHVEAMAYVDIDDAWIEFRSFEENFRPFLKLVGSVDFVSGDFPCDVGRVSLRGSGDRGSSSRVVVNYDFCDDELISLVQSGLWSDKNFELPERVKRNRYELPWIVKASVIPGVDVGKDVPIVFVDLVDQFNQHMDRDKCRYDLGKVILDYAHERTESRARLDSLSRASKKPFVSLFADGGSARRGVERKSDVSVKKKDSGVKSVEEEMLSVVNRLNEAVDSVDGSHGVGKHSVVVSVESESGYVVSDDELESREGVGRRVRVSRRDLVARKKALEAARQGRRAAARLAMLKEEGGLDYEAVSKNVEQEFGSVEASL